MNLEEVKSKGIITKLQSYTANGNKVASTEIYLFGIRIYRYCIIEK